MNRFIAALVAVTGAALLGSAAQAETPALPSALQSGTALKADDSDLAKTVQRRGHRDSYRGRHHHRHDRGDYRRPHHRHGYYDRGRYGRGYYGPSRYDGRRCWREERYGHFRGRPAIVTDRVCRDRRGYVYVERGSTRLVHFIDRRGRHGRY